jgi:hypothetical protein
LQASEQHSSYSLTEDPSGQPVESISVNVNPPDGVVDSSSSSSDGGSGNAETVIVVDEQTGEALAVGAPLTGNVSSGGYSYSADGSGSSRSSDDGIRKNFTGGWGHDWADSSSNETDSDGGIKLPFGKKFKVKKALHKLKADLLSSLHPNISSSGNATCSLLSKCTGGACLTPSCLLNGAGKEVLTMKCYGTNIIPNPLLDATIGNPCANLACKLDNTNCTSGPLGLGGFCTGTVQRFGVAAKLHPAGAIWEGYPCIEHKGPLLAMLPKVRSAPESCAWGEGVQLACVCGGGVALLAMLLQV